jgi:MoxR-like ATPase
MSQPNQQLVFVTGEPGIGKTTLVQSFLDRAEIKLSVGRGQCLEQYGASEAYLPMLEAASRLCRGPDGESVVAILRKHAPQPV